jgi:hypothetical protein
MVIVIDGFAGVTVKTPIGERGGSQSILPMIQTSRKICEEGE